jgi:hypothetical protein
VADAAVDEVGHELHAVGLELGACGRHVVDLQRDRQPVRMELLSERGRVHHGEREVAGLELVRRHVAPLLDVGQAEHGAVEVV